MTLLTVNQLADLTGLDRRTINKRLGAFSIVPVRGHKYHGAKAFAALYNGDAGQSTLDERKERARKYKEEADNLELKNHQLRGEWVPLDEAVKFWCGVCQVIRERLLSLPSKLQSQFNPGLSGENLRKMAQTEVDDCLNELAKRAEYEKEAGDH